MPKTLIKRSVNAAKVTDHHALLITDHLPKGLAGSEEQIYDLVISRMLEDFHETSISDKTVVRLDSGGVPFKATGSVLKRADWRSVRGLEKEENIEGQKTTEENPETAGAAANTVFKKLRLDVKGSTINLDFAALVN